MRKTPELKAEHKHLYIVTHREFPPGYQAVQGMHAAIEFVYTFPKKANHWYYTSEYLAFLSVKNRLALMQLYVKAVHQGIKVTGFAEPDLDFQITALALEPGEQTRALLQSVPLALRWAKEYPKKYETRRTRKKR